MTNKFENKRNEFMQNLRSELARKSSIMASTSDDSKLANSSLKLTTVKPIAPQKRLSFSKYRNSIQGASVMSDTISSTDFNRNLKNLIGVKNLRKVKALFMSRDLTLRSSIYEPSKIEFFKNESAEIRNRISVYARFKRTIKLVLTLIKLISIHKVSKEKIKKFGNEIKIDLIDEEIFDPTFYSRPHEPAFPDEAKKMLATSPNERSEEMLRYIMISLNFSVPEFSELPIRIQKMWAQFAFYQEFEPERVIVRQGHYPANYYMIISGKAMVIEASASWVSKSTDEDSLVYTPLLALKRGDCFGDLAIINNTKRTSSIKVSGNKPISLLCVDKEDFFRIQGSKSTKDKLKFLKTSVPLLNNADYPFDDLEAENKRTIQVCFSIYYRNGVVISENSQHDEWIYIIKSGSSKLVKRIRVNSEAVEAYWSHQRSKRSGKIKQLESMFDVSKHPKQEPIEGNRYGIDFGLDRDGTREVFLELPELNEGDIFGLNDVIFDRELDGYNCSLMLISQGVECVLVNRRYFQKHLSPQAWFKLRLSSPIYPSDEYFAHKYFGSFVWKDFKDKSVGEIRDKVNIKDKVR